MLLKKTTFFVTALIAALPCFAQSVSPAGTWRSIDDETHKARAIITISEPAEGELQANLQEVLPLANETPRTVCQACKGELKNSPLKGLRIVWDMHKEGEKWQGGSILDPKTGKVYRCNMQLIENGQKLKVRGFIGFSLLGRTQIWERVSA